MRSPSSSSMRKRRSVDRIGRRGLSDIDSAAFDSDGVARSSASSVNARAPGRVIMRVVHRNRRASGDPARSTTLFAFRLEFSTMWALLGNGKGHRFVV